MFGLKLKAFYEGDIETSWNNVEGQVESSDNLEVELERLKNEMDTVEHTGDVKNDVLNMLTKEKLAKFLSDKFFADEKISYVNFIKTSPNILNLCMNRALQLLSEGDTTKYDDQWNESENWKTVKDLFDEKWINTKKDSTLIRILQKKVWAVPDWKPWPQTVALVISHLWWDIWDFYDKVNSIYEKVPELRIKKVQTYDYDGKEFKYDTNIFFIRWATDSEWPRIVDAAKKDDEGEKWVEIRVVGEGEEKHLEAEGYAFTSWWLRKVKKSSEWWMQSEEDPLKGLTQWTEYSEENGELIKRYKTKLDIPTETEGKKEYIKIFGEIMNDSGKNWAFKSLLDLNEEFWRGYKLNINWLKNLNAKLWTSDVDWDYGTFETVDDKDDYLTIKGGKLVEAENDSWHHEPVFEANGTSSRDDYRFDSIEAFIKFISWEKIISASKYVKELAESPENNKLDVYKNRFTKELWDSPAELESLGSWDRYETFLSLLALGDKFWGSYKLTKKDLKNFIKWMDEDIFDYRSGSSTVFHAEWSKFEVDWTGRISDDTFESVSDFFTYLAGKV